MDPQAQAPREGQEALKATVEPAGRPSLSSPFGALLDAGWALLGLSMEELGQRLTRTATIDRNASYGSLESLTELYDPARSPARVLFGDPSGPLLIYIGDRRQLAGIGPSDVRAELGPPEAVLACRAGKEYAQWVFPAKGVAVAASADDLAFVEIFPPLTLEEYQRTLYEDPGPFVR